MLSPCVCSEDASVGKYVVPEDLRLRLLEETAKNVKLIITSIPSKAAKNVKLGGRAWKQSVTEAHQHTVILIEVAAELWNSSTPSTVTSSMIKVENFQRQIRSLNNRHH
ncbi:hypothetical protein AOLI_G00062190 [Acnodon oligacanthus]